MDRSTSKCYTALDEPLIVQLTGKRDQIYDRITKTVEENFISKLSAFTNFAPKIFCLLFACERGLRGEKKIPRTRARGTFYFVGFSCSSGIQIHYHLSGPHFSFPYFYLSGP